MTTYIYTKEQFLQFNERFVQAANNKNISASDMILFNILRNKDSRCGFSPITNQRKLGSGTKEWQGFDAACRDLRYRLRYSKHLTEKFGIVITDEIQSAIVAKIGS